MILRENDLARLAVQGHWVFGWRDVVRYSELDAYGHVNNKTYHAWFENLRVQYLSEFGFNFAAKTGVLPVVRAANVQFDRQMFLNQSYIAIMRCNKLGNSSLTLDHIIWADEDNVICARGSTVMVMLDAAGEKTVPVPDKVRDVMIKRDKATQ